MNRPSMTSLANQYGSDKGTEGPDLAWGSTSNYTDIYEAYLWPEREEPVRLLEIGMGVAGDAWDARIVRGKNKEGGASIKMWADYFPQGHIYGIDVNPAPHLDTDRITTFVADQGDTEQLGKVVEAAGPEPFDVIVDDGSHFANHQQISFGYLFKHLKPGVSTSSRTSRPPTTRDACSASSTGPDTSPNPTTSGTTPRSPRTSTGSTSTLPALMAVVKVRRNLRQPVRKFVKFRPDSDRMCVIRKRGPRTSRRGASLRGPG